MVICEVCGQDMSDESTTSCSIDVVEFQDGQALPRIRFDAKVYEGYTFPGEPLPDRCGDCGIKDGGIHHSSCDMEICPRCQGQLLSCNCEVKS